MSAEAIAPPSPAGGDSSRGTPSPGERSQGIRGEVIVEEVIVEEVIVEEVSGEEVSASWLRLLTRADPGPAEHRIAHALAEGLAAAPGGAPAAWARLLARIEAEALLPRALPLLTGPGTVAVPEPVREHLQRSARLHAARTLALESELGVAAAALDRAGLRWLALKGPALSQLLYGNPAGRACSDLDVVVRRGDRLQAARALEHLGYAPLWQVATDAGSALRHSTAVGFLKSGRADIDLHWGFSTPLMRFDLEACGMWQRTRRVSVGGTTVSTLGPEDTLLHLCMHGSKHDWILWQSIADVARLLHVESRLDFGLLTQLARRTGTQRLLRVGLLLAAHEAGAALPPAVAAWAGRDPTARAIARETQATLATGAPASQSISHRLRRTLRLREHPREKLHALVGAVARASEPREGESWPLWTWPIRRPWRVARDLLSDARPEVGGAQEAERVAPKSLGAAPTDP